MFESVAYVLLASGFAQRSKIDIENRWIEAQNQIKSSAKESEVWEVE